MNTNTVLRFLGWASLTYMWLEANRLFLPMPLIVTINKED